MARSRGRYLSIRSKLLLTGLALLLIPWMGWHYVHEMKTFLIKGQEDALVLTARAVSTVLHDRTELFHPETGVPQLVGSHSAVYAHSLPTYVRLDGRATDWGEALQQAHTYASLVPLMCTADTDPAALTFSHLIGYHGAFLYAWFDVYDDNVVYRDPDYRRLDNSDHLRITLENPGGFLQRYIATAARPGRMSVYMMDNDWRYPLTGEPVQEIAAVLRESTHGYTVELRLPRFMVSSESRIAFAVADIDDPDDRNIRSVITATPTTGGEGLSRLLVHSPEIAKILRGLDRPSARISVYDAEGRLRAVVGNLSPRASAGQSTSGVSAPPWYHRAVEPLYNLIVRPSTTRTGEGTPEPLHGEQNLIRQAVSGSAMAIRRPSGDPRTEIVAAAHPLWSGDDVIGAVVVEQSTGEVLALQDHVLKNVVAVTVLVVLIAGTALIAFASWLTMRIRRLRNSTEQAIAPDGRVRRDRIEADADAGDELGDLSRSISGMLRRLTQYTRYLERMPDTLAHELSNPLNVVNSSLDNLQKEVPTSSNSKYMERARKGLVRLGTIITNLTEAANIDDAMQSETRERFDLVELVSSYIEGYRLSHPDRQFELQIGDSPLPVEGTADHIAQMLDKLADNALDFGIPERPIVFRLERLNGDARLSVLNEGPLLPEEMRERIFDPMVSIGKRRASQSHLGLGLYIVRLIAEFHQGKAEAANREDIQGAIITVSLPLAA